MTPGRHHDGGPTRRPQWGHTALSAVLGLAAMLALILPALVER